MKVSYEQWMRESAKKNREGLVTVDVVYPNGTRSTTQLVVPERLCRYTAFQIEALNAMISEEETI